MTFKDPKVAFSRTNSRQKFTAWKVLQQYLISISVITGILVDKTKHDNYYQILYRANSFSHADLIPQNMTNSFFSL